MNLLLDVGNSRIKWARQVNDELGSSDACAYANDNLIESIKPAISDMAKPDHIFISNVAGEKIAHVLTEYFDETWSIEPGFLKTSRRAAGVSCAYDDFDQLGIDRWLAMIAAWNRYRAAVCVVDCGTAVTVDMVDVSGRHIGGYIVPGLALMKDMLNKNTQQINATSGPDLSLEPGRGTAECIGNGALKAIVSLIKSVLEDIRNVCGHESRAIITGGYAPDIRRMLTVDIDYDPDLVLKGMAIAIGISE